MFKRQPDLAVSDLLAVRFQNVAGHRLRSDAGAEWSSQPLATPSEGAVSCLDEAHSHQSRRSPTPTQDKASIKETVESQNRSEQSDQSDQTDQTPFCCTLTTLW